MSIIRFLAIVGLTFCAVTAFADASPCQLEHGYLVCHATSEAAHRVTLSFAPARIVTSTTREALVCATNNSGVVSAEASMTNDAGSHITIPTNDQGNGCADLLDMNLSAPGAWSLAVTFRDGDQATFSIEVR